MHLVCRFESDVNELLRPEPRIDESLYHLNDGPPIPIGSRAKFDVSRIKAWLHGEGPCPSMCPSAAANDNAEAGGSAATAAFRSSIFPPELFTPEVIEMMQR